MRVGTLIGKHGKNRVSTAGILVKKVPTILMSKTQAIINNPKPISSINHQLAAVGHGLVTSLPNCEFLGKDNPQTW